MKIVAINGSPRTNGNTSLVIKDLLRRAEEASATVSYFDLGRAHINDCKACMQCKRSEGCSQRDDMDNIRPLIEEADVLLLGSPVYMGDQTGLMKCFMDRLYAFMLPPGPQGEPRTRLPPGKRALAIFTCQQPNGSALYSYIGKRYLDILSSMLGYQEAKAFIIGGADPNKDLLQEPQCKAVTEEAGRFLIRS
jgi:multimeric flavodoxin WrbA